MNSRLAILGKPGVVGITETGDRGTGKTYRSILRSLLEASASPNKYVLYVSSSMESSYRAFRMAFDMATPSGAEYSHFNRSITLPNGSTVHFRHVGQNADVFHGYRYDAIAKDY